jgi:hypothetical protein
VLGLNGCDGPGNSAGPGQTTSLTTPLNIPLGGMFSKRIQAPCVVGCWVWWLYFTLPAGRVPDHHRRRAFGWSYGHIVVFAAAVGTDARLYVAAVYISGESHIDATATVLTVTLPVFVFELTLATIYSLLLRTANRYHIWIFGAAAIVLASAVVAVDLGASVGATRCSSSPPHPPSSSSHTRLAATDMRNRR